ncbi:hypothetical protein ACHAP5_002026 [Fusarium lateritium]
MKPSPFTFDPRADTLLILRNPNAEEYEVHADSEPEYERLGSEEAGLAETSKARRDSPMTLDNDQSYPRGSLDGGSTTQVEFRVSSRHLSLASPVFRAMLESKFKESRLNEQGLYEIQATEWDTEALVILLDIIHGHHRDVPKRISVETLSHIAIIVDYYGCHEIMELVFTAWMAYRGEFEDFVKQDPSHKIDDKRQYVLNTLFGHLYTFQKDLLEGKAGCSETCASMLLGSLMKQMRARGLAAAKPSVPFEGWKVEDARTSNAEGADKPSALPDSDYADEMIACESIQSKMTNQEPLDQFREIKDVVSHYDAIFASIKSPQTVNSEGLAIIRDRVAEMWASIAAADPDEREKLQENLLELGGQKKELEINYKANIKRWEALYQNRLRETMDEFRGKLAQTLVKNTARAQTHPQPQSLCQNQSKTQPQSHTQSQPPPQPQPQPGPQITVGDGSAKRTTEIRKTDKEPIMINLIEDEPEDDLEHKTEAELEDVPEDESEDEPEDEPEDDLKDDGPVLDDPVEEPVHEEPADEVMAENESAEINSAENETAETVPTKEESVENEKLGNLVTQESSRDGENLAPPSPPGNTITVGTSTMVRPSPDVETTCIMNTRSRETRSKRKAASPAPVAPIANKRQKFSRAASAGSAPGSKSGTPAEESRRSTRHSQRHSQSTGVQEFEGIANPEPGRVYLTFWAKTKEWLAVLLLPMGDFNSVGIPGSITSCGLSESLPSCYRFNKRTKKYTWAREYQDGMPLVSERIFPVMYFDGREFPHKSAIMWIEGKDLRKFHRRLGSSLVPNIKIILKYIEEHGGNQMEDDEEDVEVGQSEALGSQLPDIDEQEDSNIPEPTTAGSSKEEPQTHPTDACEDKQESEPLDDIKDPAPEAEPPVKIQKDSSVVARALSHPRLSAIAEHPFPMPTPPLSPGLHRRQLRHGGVKRLEEKPVVIDISDDESESDCNDKDNINVHVAHDESGSVWNDQDNIDAEVIYDDLESDWSIQASDTHDAFDTPSESPEDINASDTVVQCQAQPGESTVESQQPTVATDQPAQEDEGRATGSQIAQAALDHEAPYWKDR